MWMILAWLLAPAVHACSRVLYENGKGNAYTGRTMDWFEDMNTKIWAFPKGMKRDGGLGDGSIRWTSKYGSVVASVYDVASADGMNEAGLGGNMLYLAEADFGADECEEQKKISVGAWLQYMLDSFGTVKEAVESLRQDNLCVVAPDLPNGEKTSIHVSLSDAQNNSAIFEYLKGQLVIHEGPQYRVMTNSPPYDQQLALNEYWQRIGGLTFLPGTNRAADRFARLSYGLRSVPKVNSSELSVATVFSLIRQISVPLGVLDPAKPNLASTLWRSLLDHRDRRYYFEHVKSPSVFWIDLDKLDLSENGLVRCVVIDGKDRLLSGEASRNFTVREPFEFLKPQGKGDALV